MKSFTSIFMIVMASLMCGKPSQTQRLEDIFGPILDKSPGRFYNCGNPKTKLDFTWSPKVITLRSGALVNGSFVTPFDFDKTILNITLWFDDDEIVPMFAYRKLLDCASLKDLHVDLSEKCPFRRNRLVTMNYRILESWTAKLKGYSGKYIVQVELRTFKGRQLICGRGIVKVT
ncbi:hypothetical protein KUTeg_019312 [Tegillarca granosa]|uniref:MD-2-related lipid-recognition domain-containing protein n=1 Tax=Tegillarca granosa TaxID=220873 RepID=A0ABQ9EC47_TEGGR|nr:hypothetical protein KUTeg_019312 [Tegillarca granosa]